MLLSREPDHNAGEVATGRRAQRRADLARRWAKPSKVAVPAALRRHVEGQLVALDASATISRELAGVCGIGGDVISAATIDQGLDTHGGRGPSSYLHR